MGELTRYETVCGGSAKSSSPKARQSNIEKTCVETDVQQTKVKNRPVGSTRSSPGFTASRHSWLRGSLKRTTCWKVRQPMETSAQNATIPSGSSPATSSRPRASVTQPIGTNRSRLKSSIHEKIDVQSVY